MIALYAMSFTEGIEVPGEWCGKAHLHNASGYIDLGRKADPAGVVYFSRNHSLPRELITSNQTLLLAPSHGKLVEEGVWESITAFTPTM